MAATRVLSRFTPALHVAADVENLSDLPAFRFSPKSLRLLRDIVQACSDDTAERAWSIVGPYGSGKSTFALALGSILSNDRSRWTADLLHGLSDLDAELAARVRSMRRRPHLVLAFSAPDSITTQLKVALEIAVKDASSGAKRRSFAPLLSELRRMNGAPTNANLAGLLRRAATTFVRNGYGGIVIVIDEFSRTIEHALSRGDHADIHAVQELAEAANRSGSSPIQLIVLLHQTFGSYGASLGRNSRVEWTKVQGRFRPVSFLEEPENQIAAAAELIKLREYMQPRRWEAKQWALVQDLRPFAEDTAYWRGLLSQLFPLSPIASWALPRLASLVGQNERSIYAFLGSDDPLAVPTLWRSREAPTEAVYLDDLCDFFLLRAAGSYLEPRVQAKLAELLVALEHTTSEAEARVVKSIATLSLIGGPLWPTEGAITASMGLELESRQSREVSRALAALVERKAIVYRRYADEYHLWRGTDFDLAAQLEGVRVEEAPNFDLAEFLNNNVTLSPYVARRISFESGTSRVFARQFVSLSSLTSADTAAQLIEQTAPVADGLIFYVLADSSAAQRKTSSLRIPSGPRPIVTVVSADVPDLGEIAKDVHALSIVESHEEVQSDPVARTEVRIRARASRALLDVRLTQLTRPNGQNVWRGGGRPLRLAGQRELQEFLSRLASQTYAATPSIRNELINRHKVSTSVVVAVKKILAGLLEDNGQPGLGFEGNGPEVSIFRALFEDTGCYRLTGGRYSLQHPPATSQLHECWKLLESRLRAGDGRKRMDIEPLVAAIAAPPFGVRQGLAYLILWGVLIAGRDSYCLFENGTYVPEWSPELYDRMIRTPRGFQVVTVPSRPAAGKLISKLSLSIPGTNATGKGLNSFLRSLFGWYRTLPDYTRHTARVSVSARQLRSTISAALNPIEMLFVTLPQALSRSERNLVGDSLVSAFSSAVRELDTIYQALLSDLLDSICDRLEVSVSVGSARDKLVGLRGELQHEPLSAEVVAFLTRGAATNISDTAWVESVCAGVAGQPPKFWLDDTVEDFQLKLVRIVQELKRVRESILMRDSPPNVRRLLLAGADGVIVDEVFVVTALSERVMPVRSRVANELAGLTSDERRQVLADIISNDWSTND